MAAGSSVIPIMTEATNKNKKTTAKILRKVEGTWFGETRQHKAMVILAFVQTSAAPNQESVVAPSCKSEMQEQMDGLAALN